MVPELVNIFVPDSVLQIGMGTLNLLFITIKPPSFHNNIMFLNLSVFGRCGGLMVSALYSKLSSPGLSPGRGHCVVFLGKTLYSHSASLHPLQMYKWVPVNKLLLGVTL